MCASEIKKLKSTIKVLADLLSREGLLTSWLAKSYRLAVPLRGGRNKTTSFKNAESAMSFSPAIYTESKSNCLPKPLL